MRPLYKPTFKNFCKLFLILVSIIQAASGAKFVYSQTSGKTPDSESFNWTLPFKLCGAVLENNREIMAIASDNEQNIILFSSKGIIKSVKSNNNLTNWETELNLEINSNIIKDNKNLYISTNDTKTNTSKIRSISMTTGIINWQIILNGNKQIILSNSGDRLISSSDLETLLINKENGEILWRIIGNLHFDSKEIDTFADQDLKRYFEENKTKITNLVKKDNIKQEALIFINKNQIFFGDKSGNIHVFDNNSKKKLWSGKAGGKITSFFEIEDDKILIGSFDNFLYLYTVNNGNLVWKKRFSHRLTEKPQIINQAIVVTEIGGKNISFIDLKNGKNLNQIFLPEGVFITNDVLLINEKIIIPTNSGIYSYSSIPC